MQQVITTLSFTGNLGRYGDEFDWPIARLADGQMRDLWRIRPKTARDAEKYFVKGKLPDGWCALTFPRSGLTLTLSFPVETVPYLAILPNAGGWLGSLQHLPNRRPHCSTDSMWLGCAVSARPSKPRATYEWYLDIALTEGVTR